MTLAEIRANPYAFPGGYAIRPIMDDGAYLCRECIQLPEVHEGGDADGWRYEGAEIYYEGPTEHCAHCNAEIEAEYGDPEGDA